MKKKEHFQKLRQKNHSEKLKQTFRLENVIRQLKFFPVIFCLFILLLSLPIRLEKVKIKKQCKKMMMETYCEPKTEMEKYMELTLNRSFFQHVFDEKFVIGYSVVCFSFNNWVKTDKTMHYALNIRLNNFWLPCYIRQFQVLDIQKTIRNNTEHWTHPALQQFLNKSIK